MCSVCGQLEGVDQYDAQLWDVYHRIDDGRANREALVFYPSDDDWGFDDEDRVSATTLAMEKNMHERGLCTSCGRPDLRGVRQDQILSEEDARELHEMHAEQAAELRAGC